MQVLKYIFKKSFQNFALGGQISLGDACQRKDFGEPRPLFVLLPAPCCKPSSITQLPPHCLQVVFQAA